MEFAHARTDPLYMIARCTDLDDLRRWILSRVWPKRYEALEAAFVNFRYVLDDLLETFHQHAIIPHYNDKLLTTERFYHYADGDLPRYEQLLYDYQFHVDLLHDLMLELTRAANYVCDKVRRFLLPNYRLKEGVILVDSGPYMDLKFLTHRAEYEPYERVLCPYPGLEQFKKTRESRSFHFGQGLRSGDSTISHKESEDTDK